MRTESDRLAERDERARHEVERGCGCGYWIRADPELENLSDGSTLVVRSDAKLVHPHPKCSCDDAIRLRARG